MGERGIAFAKDKVTKDGIRFDFQYHTYLLPEATQSSSTRHRGRGRSAERATGHFYQKDVLLGKPLPLVLVNITKVKSAKAVYKIKMCCSLHIRQDKTDFRCSATDASVLDMLKVVARLMQNT